MRSPCFVHSSSCT